MQCNINNGSSNSNYCSHNSSSSCQTTPTSRSKTASAQMVGLWEMLLLLAWWTLVPVVGWDTMQTICSNSNMWAKTSSSSKWQLAVTVVGTIKSLILNPTEVITSSNNKWASSSISRISIVEYKMTHQAISSLNNSSNHPNELPMSSHFSATGVVAAAAARRGTNSSNPPPKPSSFRLRSSSSRCLLLTAAMAIWQRSRLTRSKWILALVVPVVA